MAVNLLQCRGFSRGFNRGFSRLDTWAGFFSALNNDSALDQGSGARDVACYLFVLIGIIK